jgi:very-short-patch-repair endonuclease
MRAARVGGLITCRTALRCHGIWVHPDSRLQVSVPSAAVRLGTARSPLIRRRDAGDPATIVHWRDAEHDNRLMLGPVQALIDLARCGGDRVDFVIGRRLIVETDGETYHSDPIRFEADRRRDARLSVLGYRVLRFSYNQVRTRLTEVEAAILAAIARGDADE